MKGSKMRMSICFFLSRISSRIRPGYLQDCFSADKRRTVFRIDFTYFLQSVNIRLVNTFYSSPAPVITPGTEFAVDPAGSV